MVRYTEANTLWVAGIWASGRADDRTRTRIKTYNKQQLATLLILPDRGHCPVTAVAESIHAKSRWHAICCRSRFVKLRVV